LSRVSWALLGLTFFISFIPVLGCGTWFLAWPVAVAAIIMGIMVLTRGGTAQGTFIILAGVLIVPISFLGQFASLALVGGTMERGQETAIMENLRRIDTAKAQFVLDKNPGNGAPVTMASLTSYLSAKEIKPVVGEQYDPMPVGQPPTATLPATKTLENFKGGDVLTAASLQQALATNSAFSWMAKRSPSPSVQPMSSPKATATVAPAATPSAKPSVSASPKPTSPPRSLISPRQSVAPDESPSSSARPSPSAKFAPRNGPRTGPRESPSQPEQSNGIMQGKQYPGQSPSATPDDDDD
jgi:hypothetical protein